VSEKKTAGEDTNVVVRSMLEARRKTRVPIVLGGAAVVGLVVYMAIEFGSRLDELKIEGPVYNGKVGAAMTPESAPPPAGVTGQSKERKGADKVTAPDGPPARVEVSLGREGQLWLDGRSLGSGKKHTLQLLPGKHVLIAQIDNRTLTQKLTVTSGDAYVVNFEQKVQIKKLTE
jgi:hypothetical protein